MAYKFFDKRFLVMPDDKSIIGKKVFYRDTFTGIINEVENGDVNSDRYGVLDDISVGSANPFYIDDVYWSLAYYDPNYECKVAYSQGKQIQIQVQNRDGYSDEWADVKQPIWSKREVYRVKPDTWYVHDMADGKFYKDKSSDTYVEFEGTEAECDAWIAEHTPKTRRYTNRELARWCADNKGQYKVKCGMCYTQHTYYECDENTQVAEEILIREWGSDEWYEPLVEVKE